MFQLNCDALLENNPSKSHLPMVIHEQEVTIVLLITWQEVVPLFANKKSHCEGFTVNIKFQNMYNACLWEFGI